LFSVPVSSSCREATFWFALSSGYFSTTAKRLFSVSVRIPSAFA